MNKDPEELGELSDESFDFKHITWKISNVFTLPDLVNYEAWSPSFSFAGATWKLAIYPYGQTKEKSEGYIDLFIVRLNFQYPEQRVFYNFWFITKNGKKFDCYSSFLNFTSKRGANGVIRYLEKSVFMQMKDALAPKGVLTIVCQMRTQKVAVIDRCGPIEPTASLLESSAQKSRQKIESSSTTCKESPKKDTMKKPESSETSNGIESPKGDSRKKTESSVTSNSIGCDCGSRQLAPLSVNKTLQDLKELFLKQEECDVIINVKEKEFRAHKAILIARSPVFASTFRNDMKEKSTGIINIEDCDPSSFSDFLCFLYCGNVEILTTENVYSLFTAADKYDVQDLRSGCLEFMKRKLSVDTFCETVTLALQHLKKELIGFVADFFAKHIQEIIVTVAWQRFVIDYPVQSNEIMIKALVPKKK